MTPLAKARVDDTRGRIMETAEALFRRLGYAKTAVADIAAELGMSPANVYRFFSSKAAIVEAICGRCLGELDEKAWAVARSRDRSAVRLERLILEILTYHKENLLTEQQVNDIVLVAIEQNWQAIQQHKEAIRTVIEVILRDGIESGEFEPVDARETSRSIMRALVSFCHPMLLAQCLQEGQDVETEARHIVAFLLRAITPRS
jgi:AcrR family transcriptional regulator